MLGNMHLDFASIVLFAVACFLVRHAASTLSLENSLQPPTKGNEGYQGSALGKIGVALTGHRMEV